MTHDTTTTEPLAEALEWAGHLPGPAGDDLHDAVATVASLLDHLPADDVDALGRLLAVVDETARAVRAAITERLLAEHPMGGELELEGIGTLRISKGSRRPQRDNDRICSALAARLADEVIDRDTGEVPPVSVIADRVAREVAEAAGALTPSYTGWRKGAMKAHGIDLDEFETGAKRTAPSVRISR